MQPFLRIGMAGDRGMRYPELTAAALQHLDTNGCSDGYSTSRTCEMSLSNHSGINFRGLVYLLDGVSFRGAYPLPCECLALPQLQAFPDQHTVVWDLRT